MKYNSSEDRDKPFYRWIILGSSTLTLAVMAGIVYSYGIFFKPLAVDFSWSRAATSGVYSVFVICHGLIGILMAWLADRFGPPRVMVFTGFMTGLGLLLSSQVSTPWHLYVSFGLMVGIGLSGSFPVCTATTARWFTEHRGLALGIAAGGIGIGTMLFVPIAERLVSSFGWSRAYMILGIAAWAMLIPCGIL